MRGKDLKRLRGVLEGLRHVITATEQKHTAIILGWQQSKTQTCRQHTPIPTQNLSVTLAIVHVHLKRYVEVRICYYTFAKCVIICDSCDDSTLSDTATLGGNWFTSTLPDPFRQSCHFLSMHSPLSSTELHNIFRNDIVSIYTRDLKLLITAMKYTQCVYTLYTTTKTKCPCLSSCMY